MADRDGEAVSADGTDMDAYLLDIARRSLADFNRRHLVAGTANGSAGRPAVMMGHFNNLALHSIAMSLSLADNAVLRHVLSTGDNDQYRIVTVGLQLVAALVGLVNRLKAVAVLAPNIWGARSDGERGSASP